MGKTRVCFLAHRVVHTTILPTRTLHVEARCQRVPVIDQRRSRDDRRPPEVVRQCPDPLLTADRGHEKGRRLKKFPKLFPGYG